MNSSICWHLHQSWLEKRKPIKIKIQFAAQFLSPQINFPMGKKLNRGILIILSQVNWSESGGSLEALTAGNRGAEFVNWSGHWGAASRPETKR